jgi:spore germination protein GerM
MFILLSVILAALAPAPVVSVSPSVSPAEEAFMLFVNLFETASGSIPDNVRVLGVKLEEEHLTVNVSESIMHFGGNANERALINQLLAAAASLPDIKFLTLLVEGELVPLPEGRVVEKLPVIACR